MTAAPQASHFIELLLKSARREPLLPEHGKGLIFANSFCFARQQS
jgi:hypothetical protein